MHKMSECALEVQCLNSCEWIVRNNVNMMNLTRYTIRFSSDPGLLPDTYLLFLIYFILCLHDALKV